MKNPLLLFLTSLFLLFQQSCDLTKTNIDPAKLPEVSLRMILPTAISQTARNQSTIPHRVASVYIQHLDMGDACVTIPYYQPTPYHFDNLWAEGLYVGSLKDCAIMIGQAQAEGLPHYEGIAKILMAENLASTTLMFGDIPYSEALAGSQHLKPAFDKQEDIMRAVFTLLDEAILLLEGEASPGEPGPDDLIFAGDASAWRKTAFAFKARYMMQMSKRDPNAAQKALEAIQQGSFSSLEEQPGFQWGGSENQDNPLAKFGYERPNTMFFEKRFAENFLEDDPRLEKYVINDSTSWVSYEFYSPKNPASLFWSNPDANIPLISYVEVAFLEAEALWQTQANAADIQAALEKGIIASMEQVELETAAYQDYIEALPLLSTLSREKQLETIMTEAYKAYYGFAGFQVWSNYRRTGYPRLTPHPRGSNLLNPNGRIPERHIYPQNETVNNSENVAAAKARQDGALMDVPLWIFK